VRRAEAAAEDLGRERDVLLEELRSAQQVRFGLERAREELQRQLAGADGGAHILQVRGPGEGGSWPPAELGGSWRS
jgi:hypothetical protein